MGMCLGDNLCADTVSGAMVWTDSEDDISKLYWFNMHGIFQRILEMVTYS